MQVHRPTARRAALITLGGLVLAALAAGCAEERPAINRVQPLALDKSFFVGEDLLDNQDDPEFWTQATLIDVGYGAAQDGLFTSTYAQPMSRIKWEITEELLIGRIAYERVEGSDGKGIATGKPVNDGIIAVAFKIRTHFDVANAYNPITGEKVNIIEENNTDRPWFERRYMRVDFSQNLSVDNYDFDTLSMLGIFGGLKYTPLRYDVTDVNHPDAPVFSVGEGYFDITNKAFAAPQVIDLSFLGWGIDSFPACFLDADFSGGTAPSAMCSPVELTIRHAFRRVVDTDYEPADWDGLRFQAYGAFNVERTGFTRNFGMTDQQWRRFINRYQIWNRSHFYEDPDAMFGPVPCNTAETTPFGADPNRDDDDNGTADECEAAGRGSYCDIFKQKCTLPFSQREPKTIVWHYTETSDPDFFEPTRRATSEWDAVMRTAVRIAKYTECTRLGETGCDARYPIYFGQQDENDDLLALVWEVSNCRAGLSYQGQDCDRVADEVGGQRGYSAAVIDIAKMPPMIVLCNSPVHHNDPAECGDRRLPEGLTAADCASAPAGSAEAAACDRSLRVRMGDLRYHQVNVIATPMTPSPWGIYTDAEDPLTGETVSASINVWSQINDIWSQGVIDRLRFIKGELKAEDITEGTHIRDYAGAAEAAAGSGGLAPRMDPADLNRMLAQVDTDGAFKSGHGHAHEHDHAAGFDHEAVELPPDVIRQVRELKRELHNVRASLDAPSALRAKYLARANAAKGTEFEAALLTPQMQTLAGVGGMPMSEAVLDLASPLRMGNPAFKRDLYHWKQVALAERGTCVMHEAPAPLAMTGLADALEAKFGRFNANDDKATQQARAERMRRYIARQAHYAVMAHEMGHSVAHRHNFVSSSDAFNYRPQYWQLRTRNGAVTEKCDKISDGADCVGPRYYDPMTPEERDNMIWMFMHSSVMDYAGEAAQDFMGLGAYDFAAARMFYGDSVAVFADESFKTPAKSPGIQAKMDNFGGILGFSWDVGEREVHYSELNNVYELISDCRDVDEADFVPGGWDKSEDGEWHPVLDGKIVKVDGKYSRCRQQPVDYVRWRDLRSTSDGSAEPQGALRARTGPLFDRDGRLRVPYGFGTDSWADLGNLSVYRHDNGADPYELFDFFITSQELNHIFDNYRRGRNGFTVRNAVNRVFGRFNEKLRDGAKGLGLLKNIYRDFSALQGYSFDTFWPVIGRLFFRENLLASTLAFDHFTRQLARPEIGPHFAVDGDDVLRSEEDFYGTPGRTLVRVPNGATGYFGDVGFGGRPVANKLDDSKGEFAAQYTVNAGSYYEKLFSALLLTESVDNFISASRGDFVDGRYRSVSLADLFPEGYRRWLANNLTGDDFIKGMRVAADGRGEPLTDSEGFPDRSMGWVQWWGTAPRVCYTSARTTICGTYGDEADPNLERRLPRDTAVLDPQVGWDQQKYLIAWTMMYLPENQQQTWIDHLRIWELGVDADPGFDNRIEFHHPTGKVYVAKHFGKEDIFGKRVHRGVAARVLEYANELLASAYEVDPGPDNDGDGEPDWWLPRINSETGTPIVRYDARLAHISATGGLRFGGSEGCNPRENHLCQCESNLDCTKLTSYVQVPYFLRQTMDAYELTNMRRRGLYP